MLVQNKDGAGGIVGAEYLGEVGPKDGTIFGYFTGTGLIYAIDPSRFDPDFRNYEFVGHQAGTTVYYMRTDMPPGMKTAADMMKAQGLIVGGLAPIPRRTSGSGWPSTCSA